jgi:hypothetical protein
MFHKFGVFDFMSRFLVRNLFNVSLSLTIRRSISNSKQRSSFWQSTNSTSSVESAFGYSYANTKGKNNAWKSLADQARKEVLDLLNKIDQYTKEMNEKSL